MIRKILTILILCSGVAQADIITESDMQKIMIIESSGNPLAFNDRTKARGLYQITPICLKEWNNFHSEQFLTPSKLFDPEVNYRVAYWYLNQRIPQMLKYYGMNVDKRSILIAYNFGIGNMVKGKRLPTETINYINKFNQ